MATALMRWGASVGIRFADLDSVFAHGPVGVDVMKVAVMQVINVPVVLNTGVLAIRAVLVIMVCMSIRHCFSSVLSKDKKKRQVARKSAGFINLPSRA